jgi:3-hydroxyacyl-CoA dehydrogenase
LPILQDDVDRVMRWGFGWDLGPFEIADAIGVDRVIEVARQVSPKLLERGVPEIWKQRTKAPSSELQILKNAKDQSRIVKKNAGASLVDIDDGVLAIEFHSKMNAIGSDTLEMLQAGVREAERNFAALVVGNDAPHFSAGANLMLLLLEAQEEELGRHRPHHPAVPAVHDGAALLEGPGRRRTSGSRTWRRM